MTERVAVATVDGERVEAAFPLHVTMFGVACVIIPEAERAALSARPGASAGRPWRRIANDAEVSAFLRESLCKAATPAVHAACTARFGAERTPTLSALYALRRKLLIAK